MIQLSILICYSAGNSKVLNHSRHAFASKKHFRHSLEHYSVKFNYLVNSGCSMWPSNRSKGWAPSCHFPVKNYFATEFFTLFLNLDFSGSVTRFETSFRRYFHWMLLINILSLFFAILSNSKFAFLYRFHLHISWDAEKLDFWADRLLGCLWSMQRFFINILWSKSKKSSILSFKNLERAMFDRSPQMASQLCLWKRLHSLLEN